MSSATYRTLLRAPGAAAFFLTASAGRVGIAMTSLGIVWLVHDRTGSYAAAGLVTGGFAVADALVAPQLARLIDRFGQTRVLVPGLLAHALSVAALMVLVAGGAPNPFMAVGGMLVGATLPQLGAMSAARWAALLRDARAQLPTAFALESITNALAYLAGPVLVSALGASGHPALGTVLAAGLTVGGGLAFAAQRRTAPVPVPVPRRAVAAPPAPRRAAAPAPVSVPGTASVPGHTSGHAPPHAAAPTPVSATTPAPDSAADWHHRARRSLLRPGFVVLAGLNLAIGLYFGAMQVSVTAFTVQHGAADAAAPVFAMSSCSGLLTGWLYGARRWRTAPRTQLAVATAALALSSTLLLAAGSPFWLGCVGALTGGTVPPILVLFTVLAESTVHRAVLTQAFSWLNSAGAAGVAGAAALCGWAVDAFGSRGGFAVATTAATVMAALAAAGLRRAPRLRPGPSTPYPCGAQPPPS